MDLMIAQLKRMSANDFSSFLQKHKGCSNEYLMRELFELTRPISDPIPGDYSRDKLVVGVVDSALQFGLLKGFSYVEVYHFICMCADMLEMLTSGSITLPELVLHFRSLLDTQGAMLSEASLLTAAEYLSTTVLHHFHLYQYLLCEQQMTDMTYLRVDIQTPPSPLPLQTGITKGEWLRRENLKQLEISHAKIKEDLLKTQEQDIQVDQTEQNAERHLSEAQLEETISSLAKAHFQKMRSSLMRDIACHGADLTFHVEKAQVLHTEPTQSLPSQETNTPLPN